MRPAGPTGRVGSRSTIAEILKTPELIPEPTVGDEKLSVERPTLLPAAGELDENDGNAQRLRRLARKALDLGPIRSLETRAALAYLAKDYPTAMKAVDEMRENAAAPARRARLLALRRKSWSPRAITKGLRP